MKTSFLIFIVCLLATGISNTGCKKLNNLEKRVNTLQARCDSLADALKATNAQLQATNNTVTSQGAAIAAIQAQLTTIAGQIATINTKLTENTNDIAAIESQLTVIVGQIATLNTQLAATNSNVTDIQTQLATVVSQIADLTAQLATTNANVSSLNDQLSASNAQLNIMLGQLNALCGTVPTLKDFDGNVYKTVIIGTQVWMAENLKVTHYRNGDAIPYVANSIDWAPLTTGAYCDWGNDPANGTTYGHLYNFYSVTDSRNLCPTGWHVPSLDEWNTLINNQGGLQVAGAKLREAGTVHWFLSGGTNTSGFSALAGSWRGGDGLFYYYPRHAAWWWTSTDPGPSIIPYTIVIDATNQTIISQDVYHTRPAGNSIRCIKD